MPDIDIDFVDREQALKLFDHVVASRLEDQKTVKHNTGVYFHEVPVNAVTGLSAIPYDQAEEHGYFKIDFLNVGIYKGIQNEAHLDRLMNTEPLWDLLLQDDFTNLLFHVNGHGSLLRQMKPSSIEELAMCLALIRPAKRHLVGKTWTEIGQTIWEKPTNGDYYFKKAHAIAYAHVIVVQMNLICESVSYEFT
jgi:DNA polymerase III alpha subunit